jgi:hypothetical protein
MAPSVAVAASLSGIEGKALPSVDGIAYDPFSLGDDGNLYINAPVVHSVTLGSISSPDGRSVLDLGAGTLRLF